MLKLLFVQIDELRCYCYRRYAIFTFKNKINRNFIIFFYGNKAYSIADTSLIAGFFIDI